MCFSFLNCQEPMLCLFTIDFRMYNWKSQALGDKRKRLQAKAVKRVEACLPTKPSFQMFLFSLKYLSDKISSDQCPYTKSAKVRLKRKSKK